MPKLVYWERQNGDHILEKDGMRMKKRHISIQHSSRLMLVRSISGCLLYQRMFRIKTM